MKSKLDPSALYWASFNRFELRIPGDAVTDIARSGENDAAVASWEERIRDIMLEDNFPNRPTPDSIRAELKEYGAWDAEERADDDANWSRLVWIAAWNIADSDEPDCSEPVKPLATA